ncbi:acyl-CoA dehydrogenase, partial [Sphingomonas sp. R-74633]|nr:acyl-CoA dehydrogenase [Sphingomonas sp. R-74633]
MFKPATAEQRFVLDHIVRLDEISPEASELSEAVLEGAGQFAVGEWAPLERLGDTDGPKWTPDGVKMPAGFADAYKAYVEGGWGTIGSPAEHGGQGLPVSLSIAVLETLGTANMGFALAPIL